MGLFDPDNYYEFQLNRPPFDNKGMLNHTQVVVIYDQSMNTHIAINVFTGQLFEGGKITISVFNPENSRPVVGIYNRGKRSFELSTLSQELHLINAWGMHALKYVESCLDKVIRTQGLYGKTIQKTSSLKVDQLLGQSVSTLTINPVYPEHVAYDMGYRLALKLVNPRYSLIRELKTTKNSLLRDAFNHGLNSLTQRS